MSTPSLACSGIDPARAISHAKTEGMGFDFLPGKIPRSATGAPFESQHYFKLPKPDATRHWFYQYGGDFRNFEPVIAAKSLSFGKLDKIIRQLRLSFKENPASFDVPAFAVKVY